MSWLRKKKPNPEDGDFPSVPKHYRERQREGKIQLTKSIKLAPSLEWDGDATVIWGIDIGTQVTTVSFAYLLSGQSIEVHNIMYWPKDFPLRKSAAPGEPLPEAKEKTFKIREGYESAGFVAHPAWSSERAANYVHIVGAGNTPSAFQVRTELPFIETANERYKCVDLVEHLLKHALSVYGAVIKLGQPQWPRASDVVVTLPSGISNSAEMSIVDALNIMIQEVMPTVIGPTQVYYVPKPDLRPFEDDTWRNIDTNFQHNDTFMVVDWDLTRGDMLCTSYKVRQLPSGQLAFDSQQRSYLQCTPVTKKRDASADVQEGSRFANSLHWLAEQKCATQKVMVRVTNPFKKSEGLLASLHKALTEYGLQVGIRLMDPTTETGALSAVLWRVAQVMTPSVSSYGDGSQLVRDASTVQSRRISTSSPRPSELGSRRNSRIVSSYSEQGFRPISIKDSSGTFASTPLSWSLHATHPDTPITPNGHMYTGQPEIQTPENITGPSRPSTIPGSPEDETTDPATLPPAYIDDNDTKSYPADKRGK